LKTIGDLVAGKGLVKGKGMNDLPTRTNKEMPKTEPSELLTQNTYENRGEATSILRTTKQSQSPLPNYLTGQIGRQISQSIINGERTIKLQLKPPELGMVKIEINIQDNVLKLGVITENSMVKDTLLANIHELRETLSDQGIKLDKLNVDISHNFEQSLTDTKENSKDKYGSGQKDGHTDHSAHEALPDEEPVYTKDMLSGDYLLDLIA
jgi:flagellar hook-length control protein FliK